MMKSEYEYHGKIKRPITKQLRNNKGSILFSVLVGLCKFSLTKCCVENPEPHPLVPIGVWEVHLVIPPMHHCQSCTTSSLHHRRLIPLQSLLYVFYPPSSSCFPILNAQFQHCVIRGVIWIYSATPSCRAPSLVPDICVTWTSLSFKMQGTKDHIIKVNKLKRGDLKTASYKLR